MRVLWGLVFAWALGTGTCASAAWHEASSDHFVVYADDSAEDIARFAEMLERYHSAMELLTGREMPVPSPSNRVTIYAVGDTRDMRKLSGSRDIAGFYVPRAGRSIAFVQNIRVTNGDPDFSMVVLMHEYAHHFLISSSRFAMPSWLSEGAAEFFAAAKFPKDGSVQVGRPAEHRAGELLYGGAMSPEQILDYDMSEPEHDAFYGYSWLLYHYLTFGEGRQGQLGTYWNAVARGEPSLDAARATFGDFGKLAGDLRSYMNQRRWMIYNVPSELAPIGAVAVRPVSAGMGEMLPLAIISQRGVDREGALDLLPKVRRVAERFPDDADVLAALAEAEYDAGNDAEAVAAADRALAIDPRVVNALLQKGYALFRMGEQAEDRDGTYRAAMAPFEALNKLENDHPLPLIFYYRSYFERRLEPPANARAALERAAELAPFDQSLWMNAAIMEAGQGEIALARSNLRPLAADPHGGELATEARLLLAALENAAEGERFDAVPILMKQRGDEATLADAATAPAE